MQQETATTSTANAEIITREPERGKRIVEAAEPQPKKILSFAIPCYNSAEYMDHAIMSILEGGHFAEDLQIIIVDDGSTKDNTAEIADSFVAKYPKHIKAVHQENGGHGIAVLSGMTYATGTYFKVVDSDDWVDAASLNTLLRLLRSFSEDKTSVDLVITNYVYEHTEDGKSHVVDYHGALKRHQIMDWSDIGHFGVDQYLLMHSLCYRRQILLDGGVPMPAHTFYVDNIYAYVPLPRCKSIYYLDVDLYRYFIGRDDQSVNEQVMVGRIDQQLRVTRIMMDAYHIYDDIKIKKLRKYMQKYFNIMMSVSSVFAQKADTPEALDGLEQLWNDLKAYDEKMYKKARHGLLGIGTNLPGEYGKKTTMVLYKAAQKLVKFN